MKQYFVNNYYSIIMKYIYSIIYQNRYRDKFYKKKKKKVQNK